MLTQWNMATLLVGWSIVICVAEMTKACPVVEYVTIYIVLICTTEALKYHLSNVSPKYHLLPLQRPLPSAISSPYIT